MLVAGSGYQSLAKPLVWRIPFWVQHKLQKVIFMADQLFHLDKAFYAGLAYFILFVLAHAIGRVIDSLFPWFQRLKMGGDIRFRLPVVC